MPNLSELFINDINKQNMEKPSDAGWQVGAELAKLQQTRQAQAQQIKQKMEELQNAKYEKLYSYIGDAKNYMNAGDRNRYLQTAVGYRNALGISPNEIPDEQIKGLGSDENMGRIAALDAEVQAGRLTPKAAGQIAANPQQFSKIVPLSPEAIQINKVDWNQSQQDFFGRQNAIRVAEIGAQTQLQKQKTEIETTGSQEADKKTGADQAKFVAKGGLEAAQKKIDDIQSVIDDLESGKLQTGTIGKKVTGAIPFVDQDTVDATFDDKFKAAKDKSRGFISLKDSLDSQFSQEEGERIYNMKSLDKRIPTKANIERMKALKQDAINLRDSAVRSFEAIGRPVGYTLGNGKSYTKAQLEQMYNTVQNPKLKAEIGQKLGVSGGK